jgi:hypothetical protein
MPQELIAENHADGVLAAVVRPGVAFPVAIETGKRICAAGLKYSTQNILDHEPSGYLKAVMIQTAACSKLVWIGSSGLVSASPGLPRGNVKKKDFVACAALRGKCSGEMHTQGEIRWSTPP